MDEDRDTLPGEAQGETAPLPPQQQAAAACVSCGTDLEDGAKFCRKCGTPVARFCRACGAELSGAAFCPQCGVRITTPPPPPPPGYANPAMPPPVQGMYYGSAAPTPDPLSDSGLPLADWGRRLGARVIDWFVLLIPMVVATVVAVVIVAKVGGTYSTYGNCPGNNLSICRSTNFHQGGLAITLGIILPWAVQLIYYTLLNGLGKGQTVGNIALGIAVRDPRSGSSIGLGRSLLRWIARFLMYVFVIPGLLSDLWPLWDDRRQTLADKACGSVMVRVK